MPARIVRVSISREPPRSLIHCYFSSCGGTTSCPAADTEERKTRGYLGQVACIRRLNAPRDNEMTHLLRGYLRVTPVSRVPDIFGAASYIEARRTLLAICHGVSPQVRFFQRILS